MRVNYDIVQDNPIKSIADLMREHREQILKAELKKPQPKSTLRYRVTNGTPKFYS